MTQAKPNLTVDNSVVGALEASKSALLMLKVPKDNVLIFSIQEALPLARRQAKAEAVLIETRAALRWVLAFHPTERDYRELADKVDQGQSDGSISDYNLTRIPDCPTIIKQYLEEK